MKRLSTLVCVYLVSLGAVRAEDATTLLTFDDLAPGPDWAVIQNGYGSLQWNYFGVINGFNRPAREGYRTGTVSPENVAFNILGDPASISSGTAFKLDSAYLTAAFIDGLQIRVQGFIGTTLIYDNTYTLARATPTLIHFNYVGIDRVTFTPAIHSGFFAMDNLVAVVDSDGDGVLDDGDQCPDTAPADVVNEHGCSIDQLVPCAGPATGGTWRNHGQYVVAVARVAQSFYGAGLITIHQRNAIVREAAKSDCGREVRGGSSNKTDH